MTDSNLPSKTPLVYGDNIVRKDERGLISLTDMWYAAGKPDGKDDPRRWNIRAGSEFIDFIAKQLNVATGDIYQAKRGRFGGTWAHWQIALAYAKYLSPEFHAWANQVIKERLEENQNPELGIERSRDRAIANWKRQGKSEEFIAARLQGIEQRNHFTKTLAAHGVNDGRGIATCTNSIYQPLFGGTAATIREKRGLRQGQNVRDSMSRVELAATMFSEALASERIEHEDRSGAMACASACLKAGTTVAASLTSHRRSLERPGSPSPSGAGEQLACRFEALRAKLR